jgi:predicted transcriptional regulator of viral defense system
MRSQSSVVRELSVKNGLFRARDAERLGVTRTELSRMVRRGEMVRVGRGLYSAKDRAFEQSSIVQVSAARPGVVICLTSALSFHDLTTQIPRQVWIAIGNKAATPHIDTVPIRVVRFSGASLSDGVESHVIDGVEVLVTGVAKTVVDCFKFRNKIGLDVALEALRDSWTQRRVAMDELWHYARICRVPNVMRPYLESLV